MGAVTLSSWGDAPLDTMRFRVGAFVVWAEVGGKKYRVSSCTLAYSDSGLPVASISIPLGRELGVSTADKQTGELFDAQVFKKFTDAKILIEATKVAFQDAKIGEAMDQGSWLALDGYISSIEYAFQGQDSAVANIRVLSRLASMSAVNMVFSRFSILSSFQAYVSFTGADDLELLTNTNPDFWSQVIKTVERLHGNQAAITEKVKNERNPAVQRLLSTMAPVSTAVAKKVRDLFVSHTKLDTGAMSAQLTATLYPTLQRVISNAVKEGHAGATLLSSLLSLAHQVNLRVVGLATKAHVLPFWPTWTSGKIRVIPPGTSFLVSSQNGLVDQDASTIAVGALVKATVPGLQASQASQRELVETYCGAYTIPNPSTYGDYAVFLNAEIPSYVGTVGLTMRKKEVAKEAKLTSGSKPPETKGEGAEQFDPSDYEQVMGAKLVKSYGRLVTYDNLFGGHETTIEMPIRQDIVPGCNIRVDSPVTGKAGESLSLVGYVKSVQIVIDANASVAKASYSLTHVRYVSEQTGIIDVADEGVANAPFMWEDKADEHNKLTLWEAK